MLHLRYDNLYIREVHVRLLAAFPCAPAWRQCFTAAPQESRAAASHMHSTATSPPCLWSLLATGRPQGRALHFCTTDERAPVQYAELVALVPFLCPRIQPRGLVDSDLRKWQAGAGPGAQQAFEARLQPIAARVSQCSICGRRGEPVTTMGGEDDEDSLGEGAASDEGTASDDRTELRFTTRWRLDVSGKECQLAGADFCCGMCRMCMDIGTFVQFCALRAGRPECQAWCAFTPVLTTPRVPVPHGTAIGTFELRLVAGLQPLGTSVKCANGCRLQVGLHTICMRSSEHTLVACTPARAADLVQQLSKTKQTQNKDVGDLCYRGFVADKGKITCWVLGAGSAPADTSQHIRHPAYRAVENTNEYRPIPVHPSTQTSPALIIRLWAGTVPSGNAHTHRMPCQLWLPLTVACARCAGMVWHLTLYSTWSL